MRRYYAKEHPEFAAAVRENPEFAPRFHLLYSEREAEQDAYFWFLRGYQEAQTQELARMGIGPDRVKAVVDRALTARNGQKVSEAVSGAESGLERNLTQRTEQS